MVARPQIDGSARGRAGVPLARAQRLAEKADAKSRQGKSAFPLVSAVCGVLVLGLAGYFYGGSNALPTVETETAPVVVPVIASTDVTDQMQAVQPPVVEAEVANTVDQPSALEPSVASVVEPVAQLAPRPVLAPCVRLVEQQLLGLHNANNQSVVWDVKSQRIRDTVQSILDCDLASFDLTGDYELAASELAALQVSWDRSAAKLKLTVVDSVAPTTQEVVFTSDGQPIAFIVN